MAYNAPSTVKEVVVDLLRKEGYDFITACEIYEKEKKLGTFDKLLKAKPGAKVKQKLVIGKTEYEIRAVK
jgi:hypothetical protein